MTESVLDALPRFAQVSSDAESAIDGARPDFGDLVQDFSQFGQPTVEVWEGPIRYLINEYWTAGQRQAHSTWVAAR